MSPAAFTSVHPAAPSVHLHRSVVPATLALVAVSAFAFGANYPWAYGPLMAGAGAVGVFGLFRAPAGRNACRLLVWLLAATAGAVALQIVALPHQALVAISPAAERLLAEYDVAYARDAGYHAISLRPRQTAVALALFVASALLMLGTARAVTRRDLDRLAQGVVTIGALLAIASFFQRALFGARIYGWWQPLEGGVPFGPFVNRNHFAGWMLMATPLGLGYFLCRVARAETPSGAGWHRRLLWFSTRDANSVVMVALATLLMAAALVLTMSRSALAAFTASMVLLALFMRRGASADQRRRFALVLLLAFILPLGLAGVHAVVSRVSVDERYDLSRFAHWADTGRMISAFPLTGTGLNTHATASLFFQTADPAHFYDAAHNDYLQVAAEGGLLVGVPAALLLIVFGACVRRGVRRTSPDTSAYWIRAGAVSGLAAIAIQEAVDFSLQIPANALLFAALAGIALRPPDEPRPVSPDKRPAFPHA